MYKKCRNLLQKSMVQQTNYGKLLASKLCFSHFRQFYTMRCQDHTHRIKNYTLRLKNTTEIKKKHKMFNLRKIYVNRMFWSLLRYWQESDFFWPKSELLFIAQLSEKPSIRYQKITTAMIAMMEGHPIVLRHIILWEKSSWCKRSPSKLDKRYSDTVNLY